MGTEKEILYAKWLEGTLSEKEKVKFLSSKDETVLKDIVNEIDTWVLPPVALEYETLKNDTHSAKKETKVIPLFRKLAIAASILIIATLGITIYKTNFELTEYSTLPGEVINVEFPDGTTARLNGNSHLSYNANNWSDNRVVDVEGQAYFDVNVKGAFKVNFDNGSVNVLGTRFEVLATQQYSNVRCYEGSVKVLFGSNSFVLKENEGVDFESTRFNFTEISPQWEEEYTRFNDVKLSEVIVSLVFKYGYVFDCGSIDLNKKFTGQYINNDGDLALKMVFNPLNISFQEKEGVIILK